MGQIQGRDYLDDADPHWELGISCHASYHGPMNKLSAESKLKEQDDSCYLTRYSKTRKVYVLSIMNKNKKSGSRKIKHFRLKIEQRGDHTVFEIHGAQKEFQNLPELLKYHQKNGVSRETGSRVPVKYLIPEGYDPPTEDELSTSTRDQTPTPSACSAKERIVANLGNAVHDYLESELHDRPTPK